MKSTFVGVLAALVRLFPFFWLLLCACVFVVYFLAFEISSHHIYILYFSYLVFHFFWIPLTYSTHLRLASSGAFVIHLVASLNYTVYILLLPPLLPVERLRDGNGEQITVVSLRFPWDVSCLETVGSLSY